MKQKIVISFYLFMNLFGYAQDRITGLPFATRSEVIAQHGMAATSQPLATQVALDILKAGGNAVDAAIAANAVLGLMEPTGCGIGGDLFAIIWDANSNQLYGLNASGRSPASLSLSYFKEKGLDKIPSLGPLPVSVPGCVDGWFEMHDRFGSLPMTHILQPAIAYARNGFPVSELIAYYWGKNGEILKSFPGFAEIFLPDGRAPKKGEVFKNPCLAATLEKIAVLGREIFYTGEIADSIEAYMKRHGGFLTKKDLESHTSEWVQPVSVNYRGYDVWELPPNGQGIAALQILNLLEGYDLQSLGFGNSAYVHLLVEAIKLAFEDRANFYADPSFADIPVGWLISKEYAFKRRKLINLDSAARSVAPGDPEHGNTIYLTVADEQGNMVSLIQSNYRGMGSGMTPGKLGFVLQDRGELFSLQQGHPNVFESGKRPFHTIIPAFITKDGRPFMSFGVMGGSMQPQGHVQIVVNLIDFGMNLQEAGDAPRIRHGGSSEPTGKKMSDGGILFMESGFPQQTIDELKSKGHIIRFSDGNFGGYQAIMRDPATGIYHGASESRKDGQAAGY